VKIARGAATTAARSCTIHPVPRQTALAPGRRRRYARGSEATRRAGAFAKGGLSRRDFLVAYGRDHQRGARRSRQSIRRVAVDIEGGPLGARLLSSLPTKEIDGSPSTAHLDHPRRSTYVRQRRSTACLGCDAGKLRREAARQDRQEASSNCVTQEHPDV
jgi:hypothetical protein